MSALTLEDLMARVAGARRTSPTSIKFLCPAHEERHPSAWAREDALGLGAGCSACGARTREILQAAGLELVKQRFTRAEHLQRGALTRARAAAQLERQAAVAQDALQMWQAATPASFHPYLNTKAIRAHGARVLERELLVPMHDERGELWNLQRILPNGHKLNLAGGRLAGLMCFLGDLFGNGDVALAEGFATAATICEGGDISAVVTFGSGNMLAVAQTLSRLVAPSRILVCPDDDWTKNPNAGMQAGQAAASAIGARLCPPCFDAFPQRARGDTDFNDLYHLVRRREAM